MDTQLGDGQAQRGAAAMKAFQMKKGSNAYHDYNRFPLNFDNPELLESEVVSLHQQLDLQGHRLFSDESKAAIQFLELGCKSRAFWPSPISNLEDLRRHLSLDFLIEDQDPRCRFL